MIGVGSPGLSLHSETAGEDDGGRFSGFITADKFKNKISGVSKDKI